MLVPLAPDAGADVALAFVTRAFVASAVVLQFCQKMRLPDKLLSEKDYLIGFLNVTPYFFNLLK